MVTVSQFRTDFPEFSDVTKFPNAQVQFNIDLGTKLVNECMWGNMTTYGIELLTAHNLVLWKQSANAVAVGGVPGQSTGNTNSKTVGAASVGYDTTSTAEDKAGMYNLTTYGKQFIHYARLFGAGGAQL